ncbi:MAG: DUF58 domain-containing protein [Phycisphaerales bacterium]|nr:DUF58 domain-containing protein [Planctomycetota bacterium]MCH8510005.1 DUF58 domain-containing protein [Phycisphaerales bacterium]
MLKSANPTRPTTIDELLDARLVARLSQLDLSSRKIFAGKLKGERRSKKRGESVEFADHRPYALGDDLRHIDWNIYGRLDRLFMKMFLEEEDLSLHIVIDASASGDTGEPNKFYYMQQVAMSMAYIGLVNLNRVAVTALGTRDTAVAPMGDQGIAGTIRDLRGRRRTQDIARFLCSLTPEGTTDFGRAAKRIAMTRRGKGIMLVLSDFFMKEGYETGLRLLSGRGYDVFALQILSPQEVEPEIAGDLRLVDIEDQDHAEVTISAPLLKKYKQNLSAYCEDLRTFCARREITALTIRTDTPIDTLILDYMRKRGLLR